MYVDKKRNVCSQIDNGRSCWVTYENCSIIGVLSNTTVQELVVLVFRVEVVKIFTTIAQIDLWN